MLENQFGLKICEIEHPGKAIESLGHDTGKLWHDAQREATKFYGDLDREWKRAWKKALPSYMRETLEVAVPVYLVAYCTGVPLEVLKTSFAAIVANAFHRGEQAEKAKKGLPEWKKNAIDVGGATITMLTTELELMQHPDVADFNKRIDVKTNEFHTCVQNSGDQGEAKECISTYTLSVTEIVNEARIDVTF